MTSGRWQTRKEACGSPPSFWEEPCSGSWGSACCIGASKGPMPAMRMPRWRAGRMPLSLKLPFPQAGSGTQPVGHLGGLMLLIELAVQLLLNLLHQLCGVLQQFHGPLLHLLQIPISLLPLLLGPPLSPPPGLRGRVAAK